MSLSDTADLVSKSDKAFLFLFIFKDKIKKEPKKNAIQDKGMMEKQKQKVTSEPVSVPIKRRQGSNCELLKTNRLFT